MPLPPIKGGGGTAGGERRYHGDAAGQLIGG